MGVWHRHGRDCHLVFLGGLFVAGSWIGLIKWLGNLTATWVSSFRTGRRTNPPPLLFDVPRIYFNNIIIIIAPVTFITPLRSILSLILLQNTEGLSNRFEAINLCPHLFRFVSSILFKQHSGKYTMPCTHVEPGILVSLLMGTGKLDHLD